MRMKKVAILPNVSKAIWLESTLRLIESIRDFDVEIVMQDKLQEQLPADAPVTFLTMNQLFAYADMAVTLGGDGTILRIAKQAAMNNVPLIGVNIGHLGYLAELELGDEADVFDKLFNGEYTVDQRMMLNVELLRNNQLMESEMILNEAFVSKSQLGKMVHTDIYVDDMFMNSYWGDGVIVSTPTGSTAYSLSAGGPILEPQTEGMIITPIAAHTLSARPIVINAKKEISILYRDLEDKEAFVVCDGERQMAIRQDDVVKIKKAPYRLTLLRVKNRGFYDVLRTKLTDWRR